MPEQGQTGRAQSVKAGREEKRKEIAKYSAVSESTNIYPRRVVRDEMPEFPPHPAS